MTKLPTGTVTLVFTDIEGSTRLLASLGSRYEAVLADHRRILRAAFSSHEGVEVDTQGDAFFYAFGRARDAVKGAAAGQRALASHDFGDGIELWVRMGIHSGDPTVTEEGYVGADVHLAARICAAGHGGQVLVSDATAGLLAPGLEGIALRSLGEHSLKDIEGPIVLHHLVAEGMPQDFPPLRTPSSSHPTNLPARLEALIGRDEDVAAVAELVGSDDVSVVTVVGPGGTGKTRVALAVGAQLLPLLSDGVFFVDLSALSDASLVVPAIAHALALRETPGRSLAESLADHLSSRQMLLILDNFEQVIEAASEVSSFVTGAPHLKVLVTSREALRIQGERVVSLSPLQVPSAEQDDVEEVAGSPAVALLVSRARAVKAGFALTSDNAADVAAICRRLDGLPLAIELAAARVNLLTPSAMLSRLDSGLKVLTSGRRDAAARQRTLRGAIAWSYDLLSPDEQKLFRRLGVFAGGWSLQASERVCGRGDLDLDVLDGLASLVDKSLVRAVEADEERLSMLETIRGFASERLEESGEAEEIRWAHAEFFRGLAEEAEPHLVGADQNEWLDGLELERANVRAGLEWSLARRTESALVVCASLWRFWRIRGTISEGRKWLHESLIVSRGDSVVRASALRGLSILCDLAGDYDSARRAAEEAAALYTELSDERGVADSVAVLAGLAQEAGDLDLASTQFRLVRQMYEELEDDRGIAVAIGSLANIALLQQRYRDALSLAEESMRGYERKGDTEGIILTLHTRGFAELGCGLLAEGASSFRRALDFSRDLSHAEGIAVALEGLATVAVDLKMFDEAALLLGNASMLRDKGGFFRQALENHFYRATLACLQRFLRSDRLAALLGDGARLGVGPLNATIQRIVLAK